MGLVNGDILTTYDIQRSFDFYHDPDSYVPFDRTLGGLLLRICIDPRTAKTKTKAKPLLTAEQSPGGQTGYNMDEALVQTVELGEPVCARSAGFDEAKMIEAAGIVGDAHADCKYRETLPMSVVEIAEPSERTLDTYYRHLRHLGLRDEIDPYREDIQIAALKYLDNPSLLDAFAARALTDVKLATPGAKVPHMDNSGVPLAFINNYLSDLGLDRDTKHRELQLPGKAYHNSVAAAVANLEKIPALRNNKIRMGQRACAAALRFASVQTIILENNPGLTELDVVRDSDGQVQILERIAI